MKFNFKSEKVIYNKKLKVKKLGNGCYVPIPLEYLGKEIIVIIER